MTFTYYAVLGRYGLIGQGKSGRPLLFRDFERANRRARDHSSSSYTAKVLTLTATVSSVGNPTAETATSSVMELLKKEFPEAFK